jgi:hypothetical protein
MAEMGDGWDGEASCSESSTQLKSSGRLFHHENKHEENNNGGIIFRLQHIMACLILNTKLSKRQYSGITLVSR